MAGRMAVLLLVILASQMVSSLGLQAEVVEAQRVQESLQVMPGIHR